MLPLCLINLCKFVAVDVECVYIMPRIVLLFAILLVLFCEMAGVSFRQLQVASAGVVKDTRNVQP